MPPTPVTSCDASPFAQLDREWATLCRTRRHRATLQCWATEEPALAGVGRLAELITDDRPARRRYFAAVLRLVRTGDELAARALLQLLVPGLISLARTLRGQQRTSTSRHDIDSDVISAAWTQIAAVATGASSARTARVILLNVRRDYFRASLDAPPDPRRLPALSPQMVSLDPAIIESACARHRSDTAAAIGATEAHLTLVAAVRSGVITVPAAELVWQVAVHDRFVTEVAGDLGLTRTNAAATRHAAVASLRALLAAAS